MDQRTLRQREFLVLLREHVAEQLHRVQYLLRRQMLIAHDQDRVLGERAVQPHAQRPGDRAGQIDATRLGASMVGQLGDRAVQCRGH